MSDGPPREAHGPAAPRLLGAVLVGGRSRRFGRDKATALVGDATLAERAAATLAKVFDRVVLVGAAGGGDEPAGVGDAAGGDGQQRSGVADEADGVHHEAGPLGDADDGVDDEAGGVHHVSGRDDEEGGDEVGAGVPPYATIPDLRPGQGPLAAIETALDHARVLGLDGAFVLACDMPLVDVGTVRAITAAFGAGASAAAPATEGRRPVEPLCAAYALSCLGTARSLLDAGERAAHRLHAAVDGLCVPLAPDAFLNVNTPDDAARARAVLDTPRTRAGPDAVRS